MKIHLIRHGHTEGTENRLYYGSTDLPVTDNGMKELKEKKELGGYPNIDGIAVYTSGMIRTINTLNALYGDCEYVVEEGFRELGFGDFEMKSHHDLCEDLRYIAWIDKFGQDRQAPNGEGTQEFAQRVVKAFDAVVSKGEDCAIFCHGGIIITVMMYLFGGENKNMFEWQVPPGEGYSLELDGEEKTYGKIPELPHWVGKHYSFFQNKECEYFPCHKTENSEDFNCIFCYCPLYALGDTCGGAFRYTEKGVKDCTNCILPHRKEKFGYVTGKYSEIKELAMRRTCE